MKIHSITLYQEFAAPVETVWEAFSDHATFGKIMGQSMTRIVDSAEPGNVNGVGSVRLLKLPIISFEETIRKSVKPTLLEYQISKGTPLKHHYGTMKFKSLTDTTSSLEYTIEIGTNIPFLGSLIASGLKAGIGKGLANYAKRLQR